MTETEIRHAHLFCGIGAGARGFNKARPSVGTMTGKFRCIGGIDVDRQAIADFGRMTGVVGTVLDLFDRSQYADFHGREPGSEWREAGTAEIHRAFNWERPHIVFLSAPCKGFSGLLSEGKSKTDKYQALNRLTLRGVWLLLEAYKDDPVEMILFENVPRIATRGRHLLDQITGLLRAYGYAVAETTHDCGEIGGLAQSRKRFLLVARHQAKVPPFLYEPDKKPLRAVGDVLGRMPMPGDALGGPMHRIPALQWKTWVRLAFVEAGSDWRSLNRLAVEDGKLRDFLIMPRAASRITLEVVSVRVERLKEISPEDAISEGLKGITKDGALVKYGIPDADGLPGTDDTGWPWHEWRQSPVDAYRRLWEQINGPGSWDANPWVWVVKFKVLVK